MGCSGRGGGGGSEHPIGVLSGGGSRCDLLSLQNVARQHFQRSSDGKTGWQIATARRGTRAQCTVVSDALVADGARGSLLLSLHADSACC